VPPAFGQAPAFPPAYGQQPAYPAAYPMATPIADADTGQIQAQQPPAVPPVPPPPPAPPVPAARQDWSPLPPVEEYGYSAYDEYPPEPPARRGVGGPPMWLIALVVVLLLIVGVVVGLVATRNNSSDATPTLPPITSPASSGPGAASSPASSGPATSGSASGSSTPPPADQVAQATALKALMDQSTAAHNGINTAITAIGKCGDIAGAITTLTNAANVRAQVATQIDTTDVSALPQGAALAASLKQAMTASATADQNYAAWGQDVQAACKPPAAHTAHYTAATQNDAVATKAKQTYVGLWNPLAQTLGLPTSSAGVL